jgi:hypothetical protein
LVISVPVLVHTARQTMRVGRSVPGLNLPFGDPFESDTASGLGHDFTARERLLLFGNESASGSADRWKGLWDSEPDNPAFLAQYAAAYYSDFKNLSPEILEAATRIDPNNGWFIALSAGANAEVSVTKNKQTEQERKDLKAAVWKINDAEKLNAALALIHQAALKPEFNSHETELLGLRIPLLPKRTDFASQIPPVAYLASQSSSVIHLRKLIDALSAGAQECAARNDVAGFRQIVGDWQVLCHNVTDHGTTLVDLLVARVFYFGPAENFRDAAMSLGLDPDAARFTRLCELKKADKEFRSRRWTVTPIQTLIGNRSSLLASLTLPLMERQVASPPPLSAALLQPSRYADHALFLRAISLAAWLLLGVSAGFAALHRYRQNPLVRSLSARMVDLLRFSDWAWILGGGILLPFLWYLAITHLTPLSSREWSFRATGFIQAYGQFGAMCILMLVLSTVLATWRLAKRGAWLGLATRCSWIGLLASASAILAVPAFGSVMLDMPSIGLVGTPSLLALYVACALLGIPVLWLLVGFSRNVLGHHTHALRRATLARMMIPTWIFGMLAMVVSIPFHYAGECHWIQQDRLFEINVDAPAMSRYEWDVTRQLRKELLEMMDETGAADSFH